MITISFPDGHQEETLMADVPMVKDTIRLSTMKPNEPLLVVDWRTWVEGNNRSPEPSVIIGVHWADH